MRVPKYENSHSERTDNFKKTIKLINWKKSFFNQEVEEKGEMKWSCVCDKLLDKKNEEI